MATYDPYGYVPLLISFKFKHFCLKNELTRILRNFSNADSDICDCKNRRMLSSLS